MDKVAGTPRHLIAMFLDALALASATILLISLVALFVLNLVWRQREGGKARILSGVVDVADTQVKVRVAVHYGTQTGTSERFAREVEQELKQRYGNAVCVQTSDLEHLTADIAEDVLLESIRVTQRARIENVLCRLHRWRARGRE